MTSSRDALNEEHNRLLTRKRELEKELEVIDRQIMDIRTLKRELRREPTTGEYRGGNEEYQVATFYIKTIIDHWIKIGNTITMLAINSNVSTKTISRIRNGNGHYVSLTTVDRLLSAMGIGDLLGTEDIPVEVNPLYRVTPHRPPSQFYED